MPGLLAEVTNTSIEYCEVYKIPDSHGSPGPPNQLQFCYGEQDHTPQSIMTRVPEYMKVDSYYNKTLWKN